MVAIVANRSPRVVVAHPNRQESVRTAIALEREGMLDAYITRFYYDDTLFPFRFLSRWKPIKKRLNLYLGGRRIEGLKKEKIIVIDQFRGCLDPMLARNKCTSNLVRYDCHPRRYFQQRVGQYAAKHADILICYDLSAYHAFTLAKSFGIKCILIMTACHIDTRHRLSQREIKLHPEFKSTIPYRAVSNKKMMFFRKEVLLADRVIVASGISANSVKEIGVAESKIDKVPLGADLKQFYPRKDNVINSSKFTILFVGNMSQMKGIKYLLEAVKQINRPDIKVIMVGNRTGTRECFNPYMDYLTVLDRIPRDKLIELYSEADLFVFPSLMEGFGRVILEAMAMGLPVITTSATAGEYILDDGVDGFVVPPGDIQSLKEKILLMINNSELRKEIGNKAVKKAKKFNWDNYSNHIVESVMKVCQEN